MKTHFDENPFRRKPVSMKTHSTVVTESDLIYAAAVLPKCVVTPICGSFGQLSVLEGSNIIFILLVRFVFLLDCCDCLQGIGAVVLFVPWLQSDTCHPR